MTLQINVDPSGLTQSQREALAGFILAYPGKECTGTCGKGDHHTNALSKNTVMQMAALMDEASDNLSMLMDTPKAESLGVRHFLPDELNGSAIMLRDAYGIVKPRIDARDLPADVPSGFPPIATAGERISEGQVVTLRDGLAFPQIVSAPEKAAVLDNSLAQDDADFDASLAFGGHGLADLDADAAKLNAMFGTGTAGPTLADLGINPAQAFGSTPAPLPLGAVAPSTADAAPLPTAPAVTPVITSIVPPPAPPVPAPTTSVVAPVPPAPAAPTNPVDLDKNGLPWDFRIHAESKAKIADGTWRKKRNCDPALIVTVEAELRQLMGAPAAGVAPSAPLPPNVPTPPPAPSIPNTAPAISIPTPPAPTAPAASVDPKAQFVQLVGKAAAAINAGKVTKEQVNSACAHHGVAQLVLLASRLDLVPTVAAEIYKLIGE